MSDEAPKIQQTWGQKVIPIKPVVHSWSSLQMFEQCGWKWYQLKIKKSVTDSQSEQMREGDERHKALEKAVRDGIPLPAKYTSDEPIVANIRQSPGIKIVEWQFGITRNWTECQFFADDVWIRGKIDVGIIGTKSAVLIDYKTGKPKSDYDQLGLFAIPAFIRWPNLESIRTAYLWLGDGKLDPKTYVQGDLPNLKGTFAHRIHRLEDSLKRVQYGEEKAFPKQPSGLCGWCPVKSCEYWSDRRNKG